MGFDLLLHCGHDIGATQIYFFARARATGDQIRIHKLGAVSCARSIAKEVRSVFERPRMSPSSVDQDRARVSHLCVALLDQCLRLPVVS